MVQFFASFKWCIDGAIQTNAPSTMHAEYIGTTGNVRNIKHIIMCLCFSLFTYIHKPMYTYIHIYIYNPFSCSRDVSYLGMFEDQGNAQW